MEKNSDAEALEQIQNRLADAGHQSRLLGGVIFVDLPGPRTSLGISPLDPLDGYLASFHAPSRRGTIAFRSASIDGIVDQALAFLVAASLLGQSQTTESLARAI